MLYVLLFVRKIFEELYPIQAVNPAAPAGTPNANNIINIFENHNRIIRNAAGGVNGQSLITTYGPASADATVYTQVYVEDTADIVSKKLLKVIEAYSTDWPTLYPEYYNKFIGPLIKLIKDSPTNYTRPVNGQNTRDFYVRDFVNTYDNFYNHRRQ